MTTVVASRLRGCDGFRVEAPRGLIGEVEETWLGPDREPAGFAVRLVDGRRGLVLAAAVQAVLRGNEEILLNENAPVQALAAHRLERAAGTDEPVTASWATTGDLVSPLPTSPPPETPMWKAAVTIVTGLALLVALEITLAFSVAYLLTGRAY